MNLQIIFFWFVRFILTKKIRNKISDYYNKESEEMRVFGHKYYPHDKYRRLCCLSVADDYLSISKIMRK